MLLQLYTKRLGKFHALFFHKTQNTSFGTHLAPFWLRDFKIKFSSKFIFFKFKPLLSCNVMQKIRKVPCIHALATRFWVHFGSLLAAKLQNEVFPKKSFLSILSLYATVICQKIKNILVVKFS